MKQFYIILIAVLAFNSARTQWVPQNSGTTQNLYSVYFTDASIGYIVGGEYTPGGHNGTILKTINGGITRTAIWGVTTSLFTSVYFTDANTGYAVGDSGTILKTINEGGNPLGTNDLTAKSNALKIYPNPTTDKIIIPTPAKGFLSILNLNGQQLITHQITEPKTQLDISNLPSGVYFVRLMGERTVQVGKIIKQ